MRLMNERVQRVFQEVFDDENLVVTDAMSAKDIPDWDSLAQIKLLIGLEEEFEVKFTTHEVASMTCVGDLKKALASKNLN